jgi:aminomethyltransferase
LGFPLRDFSAAGTNLTIEVEGARHGATVRALPFYRRA